MADVLNVTPEQLKLLVSTDNLNQSLEGVKTFVDKTVEASADSNKEYVDAGLANKLDKAFNGADSKIVIHAIAEEGTDDDGNPTLELSITTFDPATGLTDSSTVSVPVSTQVDLTPITDAINKINTTLSDIPEGGKAQAATDTLASLNALVGTGLVKMTGPDTLGVGEVEDADVATDSALKNAINAFAAKDGSVKAPVLLDANGHNFASVGASEVDLGQDTKDTVLFAKVDAESGKAGLYVKDPTTGNKLRLGSIDEVKDLISAAEAGVARYRGKFTFFSSAATAADAQAAIQNPQAGQTAIVVDTTAKTIQTGIFDDLAWTWAAVTWNGGDWAWVEDIIGVPGVADLSSGRVLWKDTDNTFDVIVDREGSAMPDDFSITHNEDGALAIKMTTNVELYGENQVAASLNASNIGYGEGMTLLEKIQKLEYSIATPEDIQAIIDKSLGNTEA